MAKLKRKSCLSVLRAILGPELASEEPLAKKIGMSVAWVKQASSGRISLSLKTASAIAYETGVSLDWLLAGNTSAPPVDSDGRPYTLESYARQRDKNNRAATSGTDAKLDSEIADSLTLLLRAFIHSVSLNQAGMFSLCVEKFAREMATRFGVYGGGHSRANAVVQNIVLGIHMPEILDPEYERALIESYTRELGEKLEGLRRQKSEKNRADKSSSLTSRAG
jgi:transcriptional regulator with XRE-family HTH domain